MSKEVAKEIRKELKQNFKDVKFSVTSKYNKVDIRWTDGPTWGEVESLVNKYEYGSFDGMQDMYVMNNKRQDIPQTQYVFTSRQISEATEAMVEAYVNNKYSADSRFKEEKARQLIRETSHPEKIPQGEIAA